MRRHGSVRRDGVGCHEARVYGRNCGCVDASIADTIVFRNVGLRGGVAPARAYIPELLGDVFEGRINPGRVFDFETDLDHVAEAYAAMDERRAIKSLLRIGIMEVTR